MASSMTPSSPDATVASEVAALIDRAASGSKGDLECQVGTAEGLLSGHAIITEVVTEVGGWEGELCITVSGPEASLIVQQATASLAAVPLPLWRYTGGHDRASAQVRLAKAQLLGDLITAPTQGPDRPAHVVLSKALVRSLETGTVIRALCGEVFMATETGATAAQRPVCGRCILVRSLVKRVQQMQQTLR